MVQKVSRRRLLATCAAGAMGALAGCADPDVAMFVEQVPTDRAIAERATSQPESGGEYASLVANATVNGTEAADDGPAEGPPFEPDRPVVSNGTVYDLHWEPTGRTDPRTEFDVALTVHADDRETDAEFADLPAIDRERLDNLRRRIEEYDPEADDDSSPLELGFQQQYTDDEQADSVLVPEPEYDTIAIAGYPVSVEVRSQRVVEHDIYRYTASERAPTLAAFGRELRERHQFELTGLSETEREFFESVIADNGSYYQGGFGDEDEEAFAGVADRLVAEPALLVDDREGQWLLAYDGTDYWVTIDFVRMEEYGNRLERVDSL
jgi:hypothetical protein